MSCPKCGHSLYISTEKCPNCSFQSDQSLTFANISLRDWFAAQVLAGMMGYDRPAAWTARSAYDHADAMLAERQRRYENKT